MPLSTPETLATSFFVYNYSPAEDHMEPLPPRRVVEETGRNHRSILGFHVSLRESTPLYDLRSRELVLESCARRPPLQVVLLLDIGATMGNPCPRKTKKKRRMLSMLHSAT